MTDPFCTYSIYTLCDQNPLSSLTKILTKEGLWEMALLLPIDLGLIWPFLMRKRIPSSFLSIAVWRGK